MSNTEIFWSIWFGAGFVAEIWLSLLLAKWWTGYWSDRGMWVAMVFGIIAGPLNFFPLWDELRHDRTGK